MGSLRGAKTAITMTGHPWLLVSSICPMKMILRARNSHLALWVKKIQRETSMRWDGKTGMAQLGAALAV
jgi:hypothetical protein